MTDNLLDPYATEVGRLCNGWARLEAAITSFAMNLLRAPFRPATTAMMQCYDPRQHLTAIKVGATSGSGNRQLVKLTVETVDYIDNFLRPRRNRFVHDQWIALELTHPEGTAKWVELNNRQPKVRTLPNQEKIVVLGTHSRYEVSELADTTSELIEHAAYLGRLAVGFTMPPEEPLPAQIAIPPRRRYLPPQQERQRPSGKEKTKPRRQPKSSQE